MFDRVYCFFEQSGTFKNVFKAANVPAFDIDILNDFCETDFQLDIFNSIDNYGSVPTIFDNITKNDLIFAFFPCTRFSSNAIMLSNCSANCQRFYDDLEKIDYSLNIQTELFKLYRYLCLLVRICLVKKIPLIIENPYGKGHYLKTYFPFKPYVIDTDRRKHGDFYNKPTQYFFFNFVPSEFLFFEPFDYVPKQNIQQIKNTVERSHISTQYARWFIHTYLIEKE